MQMFSILHLGILLAIMGAIRDYTTKFQEIRLITFYLKMFYKQQCRAWKKPTKFGFHIGCLLIARPMQSFKSYSKEKIPDSFGHFWIDLQAVTTMWGDFRRNISISSPRPNFIRKDA